MYICFGDLNANEKFVLAANHKNGKTGLMVYGWKPWYMRGGFAKMSVVYNFSKIGYTCIHGGYNNLQN